MWVLLRTAFRVILVQAPEKVNFCKLFVSIAFFLL